MFESNMLDNMQAMSTKSLCNKENSWHNLVTPEFKQFLNELVGKDTTNETTEDN